MARTEPTLRDMLQQFRHQFDHVVYGPSEDRVRGEEAAAPEAPQALPVGPAGTTRKQLASATLALRFEPVLAQ